MPTLCCSKNYQPCISSTDTQLQMYNEQSEYHFYQSVIWWIPLLILITSYICLVSPDMVCVELSGLCGDTCCHPPVPWWSREWQPAEGKWTMKGGRGSGWWWYSSYDQCSLWGCEGFNLWAHKSAYSSDVNWYSSWREVMTFPTDRHVLSDLHHQNHNTFPAV